MDLMCTAEGLWVWDISLNADQNHPLKMVMAGVACSCSQGSFWGQAEGEGHEEGGEHISLQ